MATVAMNSAISGLNAFQTSINYISDNVANSATIGFKRIDANFSSYVSASSQRFYNPGGATATPKFVNSLSGPIIQDASPTSIAVSGSGWLPVQDGFTSAAGLSTNGVRQYTRRGDFTLDQNNYFVNGAGKYLYARSVPRPTTATPNPQPDQGPLVPVQINKDQMPALASTLATYAANIPSNAAAGTVYNGGTITITDANGNAQPMTVTWYNRSALDGTGTLPGVTAGTSTGTNAIAASAAGTAPQWRAVLSVPTSSGNGTESIALDFDFGTTTTTAGQLTGITVAGNTSPAGQFTAAVTAGTGQVVLSYSAPGLAAAPAQTINAEFGAPNSVAGQPSQLNIAGGTSQYGGTSISLSTVTANGYSSGTFTGVGIDTAGNIYSTYSNGQRLIQYQIALATFNDPNGLVRQNGEAFLDSPEAGFVGYQAPGTGAAGGISPNALENSNVDIGAEFTKMIVAQRSYSANARMITTADEMLQEVVNLKR